MGALVSAALLLAPQGVSAETGAEIFAARCKVCHTIGGGRLVGPDLKGVTTRRDPAWIVRFVQGSQGMVTSGEPTALALFNEYKIPMPDQPLSQAEIESVMAYVDSPAAAAAAQAPIAVVEPPKATEAQIALGGKLFTGEVRLVNSGPTCISCHDATHDAIISGGVLARELTTVFSRLGGLGVRAILGSPPFPVMQTAYEKHPLTPDEVTALVGFLEHVNAGQRDHMPRDTGLKLAGAGGVGTLFLLGFYSLLWSRRRHRSVNQEIYDRQVKSE